MQAIIYLIALFLLNASAAGASALDSGTQQVLVQLETKYFGHSFDADSYDGRTERLEKLIFGEPSTGGLQQRIEKLVATTGDSSEYHGGQSDGSGSGQSNSSGSGQGNNFAGVENNSAADQNLKTASAMLPQFSSGSNHTGTESYPHIANLEKEILGQTYPSQLLTERLKRMEVKAFGSASDNPDLSERTDILDWYVEKKLHKTPFLQESPAETSNSESDQPFIQPKIGKQVHVGNQTPTSNNQAQRDNQTQGGDEVQPGEYPHVTALENEILGQTFEGQSLTDRLSRMETKAFGKPSKSTDLSLRTDALERYAEKKLHKKPFEPENNETASSQSQQQGSRIPAQVLSMVANSLLGGMGGMGFGGIGPGFGPGGLGAGGMPAGGSPGLGFGGMGFHQRNQQAAQPQKQEQKSSPQIEDDPAVYQATPPPASAKFLTKVGWCEVQVFGQIFPAMHLEERLIHLNRELQVKPGASSVELMDDVGLMIKAVQARNKASDKKSGS